MAVACPPPIWVMVCIPNHQRSFSGTEVWRSRTRELRSADACWYLKQRLQYRSPSQVWQRRAASWLQMQHHGSSSSSLSAGWAAGRALLLGAGVCVRTRIRMKGCLLLYMTYKREMARVHAAVYYRLPRRIFLFFPVWLAFYRCFVAAGLVYCSLFAELWKCWGPQQWNYWSTFHTMEN